MKKIQVGDLLHHTNHSRMIRMVLAIDGRDLILYDVSGNAGVYRNKKFIFEGTWHIIEPTI